MTQNIIISLRKWYISRLGINGKYYLTKMYVGELFEHIQQVYSLTTIYLCLMPVEISTIVCIVLLKTKSKWDIEHAQSVEPCVVNIVSTLTDHAINPNTIEERHVVIA